MSTKGCTSDCYEGIGDWCASCKRKLMITHKADPRRDKLISNMRQMYIFFRQSKKARKLSGLSRSTKNAEE